MKISKTGEQTSVSPAKNYSVFLRKAPLIQWMATPGSALQVMAVIGVVVVLGQVIFGSITVTAAIAEFSSLALLGIALPPIIRATFGRTGATTEPDGDG